MAMNEVDSAKRLRISALRNVIALRRGLQADVYPCQIEEGLFLGSIIAAQNKDELKRLNITHILTIACSLSPAHPNDFVYKVVGVLDARDADIKQHFDGCFDFIDEARRLGGGVLVHCFAGISRSVTVVVAYLMKKHGFTLTQAMEHVKSRRPRASPNDGFMFQLMDFETALEASREEEKNLTNA